MRRPSDPKPLVLIALFSFVVALLAYAVYQTGGVTPHHHKHGTKPKTPVTVVHHTHRPQVSRQQPVVIVRPQPAPQPQPPGSHEPKPSTKHHRHPSGHHPSHPPVPAPSPSPTGICIAAVCVPVILPSLGAA